MDLIYATRDGDILRVRALLDSGVDPNIIDNDGITSLHYASLNSDTDIVRLLLNRGTDPNIRDNYGFTPLMMASIKSDTVIIKMLLDNGAYLNNIANSLGDGVTSLMMAASNGRTQIVKMLLERGAEPNIRDKYGKTSLMMASSQGHNDIVRLIQDELDEPSDPDIDLLRDEAARYIQTIMRARIETDKKRKLTKRRYGKWASPKTEREKHRRYMDLIRQIDYDDPMKGYEIYSIYPERLLPPKKGGKRSKKHGKKRSKRRYARNRY